MRQAWTLLSKLKVYMRKVKLSQAASTLQSVRDTGMVFISGSLLLDPGHGSVY